MVAGDGPTRPVGTGRHRDAAPAGGSRAGSVAGRRSVSSGAVPGAALGSGPVSAPGATTSPGLSVATLGSGTTITAPPPTTASIPVVGPAPVRTAPCRSICELDEVFGTRGAAAHCWCQFDRLDNEQLRRLGDDQLRAALDAEVRCGGEPGLVATIGGERVGWCSVGPRSSFPRLARSPSTWSPVVGPADDPAVWSVTCFVVRPGFRRRGVATALLAAAVEHARSRGAGWLEGYPVDVRDRPTVTASDLYRGTLSLFLDAGFEVVARTLPSRSIVRREL